VLVIEEEALKTMNRWLMGAAALLLVGCAAGVDDPQPAPAPEPEQKDPPAQTFSGDLKDQNPYAGIAQGLGDGVTNLPPRQKPPVPGLKSAEQEEQQ
jgi:hypothetical protein